VRDALTPTAGVASRQGRVGTILPSSARSVSFIGSSMHQPAAHLFRLERPRWPAVEPKRLIPTVLGA
jgi:hypothetical protein